MICLRGAICYCIGEQAPGIFSPGACLTFAPFVTVRGKQTFSSDFIPGGVIAIMNKHS